MSESILKIKSARAKSVKNATDIVSNIVDILILLKWNAETEHDEEEYWAQEMWVSQDEFINKMFTQ